MRPQFTRLFASPLVGVGVMACCLAGTLAASIAPAASAAAPFSPAANPVAEGGAYWAQVKGDNVMVRSGPSVQSAYAIGRLSAGQPVKVNAVEYGWAKVAAVGPAFATMFAYIKADSNSNYDAASQTLTVTGKADLIAANMDVGYAPEKSWKLLGNVAAGEKLSVLEVKKAGADTFYSVRMPATTEVWVNNQFLASVTQEEADAIETALKGGKPVPAPMVVTPAPNAPPAPAANPQPTPTSPQAPTAAPVGGAGVTNNPPSAPQVDPEAERKAAEAKEKAEAARKAQEAAAEERRHQQMERQLRQVSYNDLESKWNRVRNEPAESAELDALRERYVALANDSVTPASTRQLATFRADQIAVRIDVQNSLLEIAERKNAREQTVKGVADIAIAMKQRLPYDAVGRLNASTVYDGDRLPLLYKLVDSTTGHTIAYVIPGPNTKPSESLGLNVGIKGVRRYDETLRVNVIQPESIDVLEKTATATTGK